MPQAHSSIQYEVTAVTSWGSNGSSLALEVFLALRCFTEAQLSYEVDKVQLRSLKSTCTTDFPFETSETNKTMKFSVTYLLFK